MFVRILKSTARIVGAVALIATIFAAGFVVGYIAGFKDAFITRPGIQWELILREVKET